MREREKTSGKKTRNGRKIECRQHGGLIIQRGTRGEIDESKEQRVLAGESIVGEKESRYSLSKYRNVERAEKREQIAGQIRRKYLPQWQHHFLNYS